MTPAEMIPLTNMGILATHRLLIVYTDAPNLIGGHLIRTINTDGALTGLLLDAEVLLEEDEEGQDVYTTHVVYVPTSSIRAIEWSDDDIVLDESPPVEEAPAE